ncbi:family 10 glycosylhydrolase [Akkermansiaceae bacterium]|nr:family 10 glycosylhydrolase [Akkermansiaceae bacterium]
MKYVIMFVRIFSFLVLFGCALGQTYKASSERPPVIPREFRGAWSACVYNIDWPSQGGLSVGAQKAEMVAMLNKMASLKMNALIFQVRPNADAVYASKYEPWSHWISGTMGRSPGYDPLAYCLQQAYARGIEVHAWFNPFRALPNKDQAVSSKHVSLTHPSVIRLFKNYKWMDPSSSFTQQRALSVIMDVVNRYDVDGIHIDDYFYPYPDVSKNGVAKQIFPDGKTESQRRSYVNKFVENMYASVKKAKPWVRVGISPFGIWRPGVPAGTTATIDSYKHLSADSRKWLQSGWCDYLSPQLYWRINSAQSYTRLLTWWRAQGKRPVWPGIASARINSTEDPGRPVSEIINQVSYSRSIGRNYAGHVFWSAKSLIKNRGGINSSLTKNVYQQPALVPPMPWISQTAPATPRVRAAGGGGGTTVSWSRVPGCGKYAVQARYGKHWVLSAVSSGTLVKIGGTPDAIAVSSVDRYGMTSLPAVVGR